MSVCTPGSRGSRPQVLVAALGVLLGSCGCSEEAPATAAAGPAPVQWFTEITGEAGLDFVHESGASGKHYMPEIMGGGVALFDCDQDGDLDLYLINGNTRLPGQTLDPETTNALYRQEAGGRFRDITRGSGLEGGAYGMGAAIGDIDNDADEDVYVTNYGPDRLHGNTGAGRFEDLTRAAGIDVSGWSSSAAFFDYDRDGFLDLYVAQYLAFDPEKTCTDSSGRPDYCGPKEYPPVPDVLLHNDGRGSFADVSGRAGMRSVAAAGLGVVCADFDENGWQDVYVANDGYANQLWANRQDGTFRDEALLRGVAVNLHGQPEAGMGVFAADVDRNGALDLFITHLRHETNTLFLADEKGASYRDATGPSGLGPSSMASTGFGTAAIDFDLDEDLDIVVANGGVSHRPRYPGTALAAPWDEYAEANLFYLNDGQARFRDASELAAAICGRIEISRGLAAGDIDSDGDVDLLIGHIQGQARLYRNDAPERGHWLTVRCVHPGWQRDALGARVEVFYEGRSLVRTICSSFSYLSSSPPRAYFGLGRASAVDKIEVRWPDGRLERFPGRSADAAVELHHGTGES